MENKIEKTPEEYRKIASEHVTAVKKMWKTFGLTGLAFGAMLAVVFVLSVAWFANNVKVSGTGIDIMPKDSGIEIGSRGKKGVHDDWLQQIFAELTYHLPGSGEDDKHSTSSGGRINWLLSESSNMTNYSDGKLFGETGQGKRSDFAIEPGTKGNLEFFIRPDESGDYSLDFEIDITPYKVISGLYTEEEYSVVQNEIKKNLLKGHILFFLKENSPDGEGKFKYTLIKDGKFSISIDGAEKGREYNYSLYWVWPLNLATVILNEGDSFLNGHKVEFDDIDPSGKLREAVVLDMQNSPGKYFYNTFTGLPVDKDYPEVKEIPNIFQNSSSKREYNKQLFVDLSSYYNQADTKIGETISFIKLTLRYIGETEVTDGE